MGNDYSTLPVTTFGKKTVSLPDNSISQDFKTTNTITELEQLRKETQTRVVTITAGLTTTVSDKTGKFNNSAVNKEIQEHNATTVANDNINILIEKESRTKPFENTEDIRKFEFKAQLEPSYDDETLNETARLLEQLKFIEEEVNKLPEESTAETLLTSEADEYELEPDSLPSPLPDVSGQDTMLTNTIKTEKAHQEERDYTIIQRFKPIDVFSGTKMVPLQRKGYTRVPVNTVGHKRVTVRTTARLVPGRTRGYSRPTRSTSNVM
ncbi:hypothetical protein JYU34_005709 [Plutella xylostella]|uniref:Uncharacterized protein n=2 Tax=Plutella xylostella TaxID=51655 RepID=A0ABQ7QTX3_PLUXY|nr:hypothetical protein JYU34_005709 [Plutella xylostella]